MCVRVRVRVLFPQYSHDMLGGLLDVQPGDHLLHVEFFLLLVHHGAATVQVQLWGEVVSVTP